MAEIIMVSSCLLGEKCRYDGGSKPVPGLREKLACFQLESFCPETMGGFAIPRPPAEIVGLDGAAVWDGQARVMNREGVDCTPGFIKGAEACRNMARALKPVLIICKAHSPSCGVGEIYDGTFRGVLRPGDGVTVALLRREGIPVITEAEIAGRIDQLKVKKPVKT